MADEMANCTAELVGGPKDGLVIPLEYTNSRKVIYPSLPTGEDLWYVRGDDGRYYFQPPKLPMTPHTAFLQAILEAPDDDAPRLIYADWLEEIGNDPVRAEFIRVQCELEKTCCTSQPPCKFFNDGFPEEMQGWCMECCRMYALRLREIELLHQPFENPNEQLWTKATLPSVVSLLDRPDIIRKYRYRRGFISEVEITCEDWINYGHHLLAAVPLERVNLMDFVFGSERPDRRVYPPRAIGGLSMVYVRSHPFQVLDGKLFQELDGQHRVRDGWTGFRITPSNHLDDIDQDYFNLAEPELRYDVVSIRSNRYT